jgi:phosphoglycolate phosphatase-like HAD superfamily hydrolase
MTPTCNFLVGIDSDGCAFDTMELKHKECFIPNWIKHYNLQGVSKYAREAAEFVNLYSKSRGINRFRALVEQLDWLRLRPEAQARGVPIPEPLGVMRWLETETKLGNPALEEAVQRTGDPDLKRALAWSQAVNESVAQMVRGVPPFPGVRECLEKLYGKADMLVVSATPTEALRSEWEEHEIVKYVRAIRGQESGTKKQALAAAKDYAPGHVLMIGDAPGDQDAAAANACLFFPIRPGQEESSWQRLFEEGIDRFFLGSFAGEYQDMLVAEFDQCLPEKPPWPVLRNTE